ncbi:MAG TPA: hypothetical protein PLV45_00905 [bacterium]|nr:hypothetical protein [bacterium]
MSEAADRINTPIDGSGKRFKKWIGALIWVAALALTLGSAMHQRNTGPTHPLRGEFTMNGSVYSFKLRRNPTTDAPLQVKVPLPPGGTGVLTWREYPTDWEWKTVPLAETNGIGTATIPIQPVAGKVEYFIEITLPDTDPIRLPSVGRPAIARYKDPVPAWALIPHVLLMFAAMLISNRLGLGGLFRERVRRRLIIAAFVTLTLGGFLFGPIVQYYAFGAAWTGWPVGTDLTDNKVAVNWLVWLIPLGLMRKPRLCRISVLFAALVTLAIYLIPHSLLGSEYDYKSPGPTVKVSSAVNTSSGQSAHISIDLYR